MVTREYTFIVGPETATLPTLATPSAGVAAAESASINNHALAFSVAASAATIALKTRAGTDPTSTDYVSLSFRSATLATGTPITRLATAATSVVLSSGSTLGQVSGQASDIYVYAIDNAGTVELAVSHAYYPENALVTTTAEGGAGAADSATVMYSTTARSNVACRLIGVITNTQTTAGTWAQTATKIQLAPFEPVKAPTVQKFTSGSGTYYTPAGVKMLRVRMVGGGGGGGQGQTASTSFGGGNGGNTTFGDGTAPGGTGGPSGGNTASIQSTGTLGSGWIGFTSPSANNFGLASAGFTGASNPIYVVGANGMSSVLANGSPGGFFGTAPSSPANSGAGAGGGGCTNTINLYSGGGGAAGAYIDAIISSPLASYAYAVGAGGTAGGSGSAGGAGGSGIIIVEEYY